MLNRVPISIPIPMHSSQSIVEDQKIKPKNILVIKAEELLAECSGTLNLLLTRVLPVCGAFQSLSCTVLLSTYSTSPRYQCFGGSICDKLCVYLFLFCCPALPCPAPFSSALLISDVSRSLPCIPCMHPFSVTSLGRMCRVYTAPCSEISPTSDDVLRVPTPTPISLSHHSLQRYRIAQ